MSCCARTVLSQLIFVLTSLSAGTGACYATLVGAQSTGADMAGGRLHVFFQNAGQVVAPIVAGAPGQGMASVPNLFQFSVTGDTFLADWTLTNQTTSDFISGVLFNLEGSQALFDDGTVPSTLHGGLGRAGAVQSNVGSPTIGVSGEVVPWADPMNLGDEFLQEEIFYAGDFGPGLTSIWRDDTDIIGVMTPPELPEPASHVMLLGAVMACGMIARRKPS